VAKKTNSDLSGEVTPAVVLGSLLTVRFPGGVIYSPGSIFCIKKQGPCLHRGKQGPMGRPMDDCDASTRPSASAAHVSCVEVRARVKRFRVSPFSVE